MDRRLIAEMDRTANPEAVADLAAWAEVERFTLPEPAALVARAQEGARLADLVNRTRYAYEEAVAKYTGGTDEGFAKGAPLRVVRGRKVPLGTTGRCIWSGEGRYGWRVGLVDADGTAHWTSAANVELDVDGDTAADLYDLHAAKEAARAALDAWVAAR